MNENRQSPVVEVDRMTMKYGKLIAVNDVSFSVTGGSVYALLGRNGSGKSTTLKCVLGQLKPSRGGSRVFGQDSWSARQNVMARVGVVPESPDVPLDMTAAMAAHFVAPLYAKWNQALYSDKLSQFDIPMNRKFASLSKGQQKQVNLALALAMVPDLLILDDPTLGLDVVARKVLFDELIGELADRNTTVLITTHDLAGIEGVVDDVGVVRRGEMLVDESLSKLKARFRRLRLNSPIDLDGANVVSRRKVGDKEEVVISAFDDQVQARLSILDGVIIESLSLEEIFLALVGEENVS